MPSSVFECRTKNGFPGRRGRDLDPDGFAKATLDGLGARRTAQRGIRLPPTTGGARVRLRVISFVRAPGRKENYLLDRSQLLLSVSVCYIIIVPIRESLTPLPNTQTKQLKKKKKIK